jgi:RimJ/RimL family protein N-acetyltransferase
VFSATDQFDPYAMQEFMRRPEIYWAVSDTMSPPPEAMDFIGHLTSPYVWTVAALWQQDIIGYVLFETRTTVSAVLHVAFLEGARGQVARAFTQHAIGRAFTERGLLKLWAFVPTDNRRALMGARHLGFHEEGRLTKSIMRNDGLRDLIVMGLEKDSGEIEGQNGAARVQARQAA